MGFEPRIDNLGRYFLILGLTLIKICWESDLLWFKNETSPAASCQEFADRAFKISFQIDIINILSR